MRPLKFGVTVHDQERAILTSSQESVYVPNSVSTSKLSSEFYTFRRQMMLSRMKDARRSRQR